MVPQRKRAKNADSADTPPTPPTTSMAPTSVKSNRRLVTLAEDADIVLAKCRALRAEMIRNAEEESKEQRIRQSTAAAAAAAAAASSEDDDGSISPKIPAVKEDSGKATSNLASLRGKSIIEVSEMSSMEVVEAIESTAIHIANQVLQKKGFSLEVPSRTSANQIYVPELDRIVLGEKRGTRSFLNVKVSYVTSRVVHLVKKKYIFLIWRQNTCTWSSVFINMFNALF